MVKRLLEGPWEHIKERFPDRQIYHRTEGQVRYFVVTTAMQLSVIGASAYLAVWLTITSVNMILANSETHRMRDQIAAIEDRHAEELEEARASEAAALAYVESRTNAFDRTAGEFQLRHDTLRRLLDFADDLVGWRERQSPSLEEGRILMAPRPADPDPRGRCMNRRARRTWKAWQKSASRRCSPIRKPRSPPPKIPPNAGWRICAPCCV
jgi:hypothetical protein